MIGTHKEMEKLLDDEAYYRDLRYILTMLWNIPSMTDKLPKHILVRLESVMDYKRRKGWRFDDGQSG